MRTLPILEVHRRRAWPLLALLIGVELWAVNGCRLGYEALGRNDGAGATSNDGGSAMSSVGGSPTSSDGGAKVGSAGDADPSGNGAAGASNSAGCTLASAPGTSYAVGEAAPLAGFYMLRALSGDECVRTFACGDAQGATYEQATCNVDPCQIFQAVERGDGWYSLQNTHSGYCLDAGGSEGTTAIMDVSCIPADGADAPRQSFQLVCGGDDTWRLVNRATLGYVGVAAGSANAATLELQPTLGGDEQRFSVDARRNVFEALAPTSEADPGELWRYVTRKPKPFWDQPSFDDSGWTEAPGGFGNGIGIGAPSRTAWAEADIWLRRTVTLDAVPDALDLRINHDDAVEIYFNGVQVISLPNWTSGYREEHLPASALGNLVVGTNVIAVHCSSDAIGEQYIDLGLGLFSW